MKIFTVGYDGQAFSDGANLGDDIQSIAAKRLLPKVDGAICREDLSKAQDKGVISMNGFFMRRGSWPPSETLEPFFFAFHISKKSHQQICSPAGIEYLKKYQPIGCRDRGTKELLIKKGVDAYYSKCVTLTFEKRTESPKEGRVFLVNLSDAATRFVPRSIRRDAIAVNQASVKLPNLSSEQRESLAEHVLTTYKEHASLVITSKIHCAMPCIAMGIPVVFLYEKSNKVDYRVEIIDGLLGINYVNPSWFAKKFLNRFLRNRVNWAPDPVNIEEEKQVIRRGYLEALQRSVERFSKRVGSH